MRRWILCLSIGIFHSSFSRDVSLYGGAEARFYPQDRERVLNVLQNMGIPFRVSSNNRILVPSQAQDQIKDLIIQGFKSQISNPAPQNQSKAP